ncbi:MAG: SpoIIE family protein phosphatase [Caulobacteraceae bacterium]
MAAINVELSRDNREDMALTLLVGILATADGEIDLCCAGHENPFVAGPDGQVRELQLRGGPPLCVDPDFPMRSSAIGWRLAKP